MFTTSGVSVKGRAYWGAYAVSKFADEGLMQVLADELATPSGRSASNSVNPGAVRSPMRAKAYPGEDAVDADRARGGRLRRSFTCSAPTAASVTGCRFDAQP